MKILQESNATLSKEEFVEKYSELQDAALNVSTGLYKGPDYKTVVKRFKDVESILNTIYDRGSVTEDNNDSLEAYWDNADTEEQQKLSELMATISEGIVNESKGITKMKILSEHLGYVEFTQLFMDILCDNNLEVDQNEIDGIATLIMSSPIFDVNPEKAIHNWINDTLTNYPETFINESVVTEYQRGSFKSGATMGKALDQARKSAKRDKDTQRFNIGGMTGTDYEVRPDGSKYKHYQGKYTRISNKEYDAAKAKYDSAKTESMSSYNVTDDYRNVCVLTDAFAEQGDLHIVDFMSAFYSGNYNDDYYGHYDAISVIIDKHKGALCNELRQYLDNEVEWDENIT